jgi:hypothetical protein
MRASRIALITVVTVIGGTVVLDKLGIKNVPGFRH